MRWIHIGISFACTAVLAACASASGQGYPKVDESKLQDVVAVVQLEGGRWLAQNPECNETREGFVVICLHSPFEMRATVIQQLMGPKLGLHIVFASSTHYDIPKIQSDRLTLVHLRTDGKTIVMPAYQSVPVGEDALGRLMVPASPDDIWWLPCGTNSLIRRTGFLFPRDGFAFPRRQEDGVDVGDVAKRPDLYYVGARTIRPLFGIPVDAIATFLRKREPLEGDAFRCEKA